MTVLRFVHVATVGALLCVAGPLAAQTRPASFSGVVYDPGGVLVANARVVLSSLQSEVTHETRSDDRGYFELAPVPPGPYRLDVWATEEGPRLAGPSSNFRMSSTIAFGGVDLKKLGDNVRLAAGENLRRDVTLQLGPLQIVANVTWEASRTEPPTPRVPYPDNWRCIGVEAPFCGPPSLVEEFERDLRDARRIPAYVQPPRQIVRGPVEYPASLRDSRIEGTVRLSGRIGADGFLTGLQVVDDPHPDLTRAALDGMAQGRWEPARLRGVLVDVPVEMTIEFQVR